MNPFFNASQGGSLGPFQNMANVAQQLQAFARGFQGNPQQRVEELMRSGQMSQAQFQQYSQLAQSLRPILG